MDAVHNATRIPNDSKPACCSCNWSMTGLICSIATGGSASSACMRSQSKILQVEKAQQGDEKDQEREHGEQPR